MGTSFKFSDAVILYFIYLELCWLAQILYIVSRRASPFESITHKSSTILYYKLNTVMCILVLTKYMIPINYCLIHLLHLFPLFLSNMSYLPAPNSPFFSNIAFYFPFQLKFLSFIPFMPKWLLFWLFPLKKFEFPFCFKILVITKIPFGTFLPCINSYIATKLGCIPLCFIFFQKTKFLLYIWW